MELSPGTEAVEGAIFQTIPLPTSSVLSSGNQSRIFIGRTDAEADTPILWASDAKSQLTRKDPDVGKIEDRKRRG